MPFDGHTAILGVDTSHSDPGVISAPVAIDSVNRSYRGGVCRTRDPFISLQLDFDTEESKDTFENGNVSGVFAYERINNQIQPHLMVAVGNKLLAGRIFSTRISFKCIYDEIDPQWQHSFFVQAEEILVWQNGVQLPRIWDGLSDTTQSNVEAVEDVNDPTPMPVGNVMVYAHGRIFVATEENIVFASDHIYSQGFGNNEVVTNFSESLYPSSGDGFGTYSRIGPITGMAVVPRHPQPNGHGEVLVFGPNGAWAIDPTPVRNEWTDLAIQQVVLIGRGNASPHSVIPVNNDIFYRCPDRTISSFKHNLAERQQAWTDRSLSREVQRYLNFDALEPLQFTQGMFADNRVIMSCCHRMQDSEDFGKHRFGLGMVALDLDRGNTTNNVDEGFSWDGLWTGPRPTGMVKILVDKAERYIVTSFDSDGNNRIYDLTPSRQSNDRKDDVESKIKGFYIIGDLFNNPNPQAPPGLHTLDGVIPFMADINDDSTISIDYRPDRHPEFNPLMKENAIGADTDGSVPPPNEKTTFSWFEGNKHYGDSIGSESPSKKDVKNAVSHSAFIGSSFQLKINIEGVLTVNRLIAESSVEEDIKLTNLIASRGETKYSDREGVTNETGEYFQYQL